MSPSTSRSISVSTQLVGERQRRRVELRAADDEHALLAPRAAPARSSSDSARSAPSALQVGVARDDDVAPARAAAGSAPGSESQVLRPITTGWPSVTSRKCARSSGRCHGSRAVAADHAVARDGGDERDRSHRHRRLDRRVVLVVEHLEVLVRVVEDRRRPALDVQRRVGVGRRARAASRPARRGCRRCGSRRRSR